MTNELKLGKTKSGPNFFWIAATLVALALAQTTRAETPVEFARRFAEFKFVYHTEVQEPDIFLQTKSGDCDDFATLAAAVLKKNGYTPRLFAVRMKGETHVVCYVPETGSYLDYNNRAEGDPLVLCEGTVRDIASKVAKSFGRNWHSAYEFSYREKVKWLVNTVVQNDSGKKTLLATVGN
jgi:hypothetical protein